ncbi:putative inactive metalloprotease YmfF [Erysipelotrichaceae bacterium]|nr:putative inactive metalloprotease YmfF [Erysipelotrichaceae bacterium]
MIHIEKNAVRFYNLEQSKKFDTISVEFTFSQILDKKMVAVRNLACQTLIRVLEEFPSKRETRAHFANLYAARVGSGVGKNGGIHEITFQFTFADPLVVKDEAYTLDTIFECMQEVMFKPRLENEVFLEQIVQVEKRMMQEKISQLYDDKMHYAQLKLVEKMYENTPFAIKAYGELADYDMLTSTDVFRSYTRMLAEDSLAIYAIGNVSENDFSLRFDKLFANIQQEAIAKIAINSKRICRVEKQTFQEFQDIKQTKLHIGYAIPITIESETYIAQKLAIDVLGGGSQSKLFQEVREKASLAYYASSTMDAYAQAMYIYAGVDESKKVEAEEIIDEQIICMQEGNISEQELSIAKLTAVHRITSIQDTQTGCIMLRRTLAKLNGIATISEWIEAIEGVSLQNIIDAAKTWEKDTVFILSPDGSAKNE